MKGLTIGIAALACAGLVAGGALAAKAKVTTSVTVTNPSAGVYTGQVTAKKGCDRGRVVVVWHDTNGNGPVDGEPDDFRIGGGLTDGDGKFTVNGNQAPRGDNVIVVVGKSKRKKAICKEGTTTIQAGPGARR